MRTDWIMKDVYKRQAVSREVAEQGIVLMKNTNNFFPIAKDRYKKIVVIGENATRSLTVGGGSVSYTHLDVYKRQVSILQGIKNAVGNNVEVIYEPSNEIDKAYLAAQKADIAIVCVGNHVYGTDPKWKYSPVPSDGREAVDRKALSLEQEDLVKIVHKANPNTVMVLVSSFPFAINWSQENIPAILHITNNSQELGNGMADVIFGNYNPAGRTNQTWVKSIADLPPMMDYDIRNGRTYMYAKEKPLYPFGYGLSYTNFSYSDITLSSSTLSKGKDLKVSVNVKNTGDMDGEEVAQLYVSFPQSKVVRPIKQLKDFDRISIKKGESKTFEFTLSADDLAYWDNDKDSFAIEPGTVNLMIGSSSEDIKQTKEIQLK